MRLQPPICGGGGWKRPSFHARCNMLARPTHSKQRASHSITAPEPHTHKSESHWQLIWKLASLGSRYRAPGVGGSLIRVSPLWLDWLCNYHKPVCHCSIRLRSLEVSATHYVNNVLISLLVQSVWNEMYRRWIAVGPFAFQHKPSCTLEKYEDTLSLFISWMCFVEAVLCTTKEVGLRL